MSNDMSEKEAQEILRQFNEGRQNVHTFFKSIVKSKDTTKTGNLTIDELGMPRLPVRTYKELAVFCKDVAGLDEIGNYFDKVSETITSSSLSKDAILIKLSVTSKKELADVTPTEKKKNKGWFKSKDERGEQ